MSTLIFLIVNLILCALNVFFLVAGWGHEPQKTSGLSAAYATVCFVVAIYFAVKLATT